MLCCRNNAATGSASYGVWLNSPSSQDCLSAGPLGDFYNNTIHSNYETGLLVTGPACQLDDPAALASLDFSNLTVYKHNGSGIVLDSIEEAEFSNLRLADNKRCGLSFGTPQPFSRVIKSKVSLMAVMMYSKARI